MKQVEKRKATGKLAELIKEFNDLPCDEKIRRISDTRVKMEKEVWLNEACDWLFSHLSLFVPFYDDDIVKDIDRSVFIKKFRKYIEG